YETYMMTPDKDYGQLLDENIYIYKPKRFGNEAEVIDKKRICEEFNIEKPEQIIDIMALWGDKSDNIPGAPGIGEKTAKKLISKYGNIENLYENINDLKGKQKENLINFEEQVKLSKKLVTINLYVPVDIENFELERQQPDQSYLTKLFAELEFKNISRRMFGEEPPPQAKGSPIQQDLFSDHKEFQSQSKKNDANMIENSDKNYQLIDNKEKRAKLLKDLKKVKEFCFDTETTSVNPHDAELVGISFATEPNEACFLPIPAQKDKALEIISPFKEIFQNKGIKKVGQNIKYDILVLNQYDVEVQGELFDTMIAHYLLQPEQRHNLDALSEKYLNYKPISIESIIGKKGKKQLSMRDIPLEKVTPYACEDADLTLMLKEKLEKELKENGLESLAYKLEMPLIYVLINMELNGVKINKEALNQYADELRKELSELGKSIHSMAGMEFNIDSPKQLGEVLFDRMKIVEKPRKTKTKQYSTSEETLQAIQDKHPIIREVLTYRSLRKLLSSYVEALPNLIHPKTGKIHTSFNQAIASTGRLSSYNPNLQNIPIREERGRKIRKAFVPSDDEHILLSADYSQIELRIMAHMSGDPSLVEAFKKDMDIHSITAANIFHLDSVEEVTQEQRRKAKTANFGIIYGISAYGLSQRLNIPRKEAAELIEEYFKKFPKVKEYMDNMISFGREHGYVKTLKGRKRFLENINSRNATIRSMAERNAINAPIQGTAADIIKIAMLDVFKEMTEKEYKSKIILQVHDELIFDACKSELEDLRKMVTYKMENAMKLDVPLTVESGTGNNWLEAH
ncbi:MAG: DNA polymerase I, partial [Bacteroidales bacterium]